MAGAVACSSVADRYYQLALLTTADARVTEDIRKRIAASVKSPDLQISAKPFAQSPYLYVTHSWVVDKSGGLIDIGDKAKPMVFKLVKRGSDCYLHRKGEPKYWLLFTKECLVKEY